MPEEQSLKASLVSPNFSDDHAMKQADYSDPDRLADVMALIQVLAQAAAGTIRSESGLTRELQGKPRSKGASTWVALAERHREFFRVKKDGDDVRVALISRYVLADDERGQRPQLSAEVTAKLLELAISLHDRQIARRDQWKSWLPIAVAIIVGLFTIAAALLKK